MTRRTNPHRAGSDFPSAAQACWLVLAVFVVEVVVGAALHDANATLALTRAQADAITVVLANGIVITLATQLAGIRTRTLFDDTGRAWRQALWRVVPPVLLLAPALALFDGPLLTALVKVLPLSDAESAMFARFRQHDVATVLVVCAIAPIVEEMLFRGIVLRGLLRRQERWHAIWASATLFAIAHLNLYQFCAALPLGLLSGWLYERTRSLLPSIALHAGYNGTLTAIAWRADQGRALLDPATSASTWLAGVACAVAGSLMIALAMRGIERRSPDGAR